MHVPKESEVTFKEKTGEELQKGAEELMGNIRRAPIKLADLEKFGYTDNCPRCAHSLQYGYGRTQMPHSEECRKRIYAELIKTDEGRLRLERMEQRQNEAISERIEREDAQPKGERGDELVSDPHEELSRELHFEKKCI